MKTEIRIEKIQEALCKVNEETIVKSIIKEKLCL